MDNRSKSEENKVPDGGLAAESGDVVRGRPGRRSVAERREAVLAVLAGKSSVDQVARQYGVLPATVEGWRDQALAAIETAMVQGDRSSPRERALERENAELKSVVGNLSVEKSLLLKAVDEWKRSSRPTRPARSRR